MNFQAMNFQAACYSYRNRFTNAPFTNAPSSVAHWTRRKLLHSAPAIAIGTSLPFWTRFAESISLANETTSSSNDKLRPKALILLWMHGGPSQLDTFDPHPDSAIGGPTRAIKTSVPDLQIADTLEQTAEVMHHATLIRSMVSKEGDHERATYNMKTGWRPDPTLIHPAIGSVLCHQSSSNLEIPKHVSILSSQWPSRGGYLGSQWDAFQLSDPKNPLPNLKSPVKDEQFQKRIADLEVLEKQFRRGRRSDLDANKTLHSISTQRAMQMMSSEQIQAFEIDREDRSTRDSFGDTPFGRGCLAAVRLVEQGVSCVEVELSGWDSHIENYTLQSGRCKILDAALHGLIKLLEARELLDSTVVVCGGEFGRTPKINVADGRDHWPNGFSTVLFGGPFRRGHIHGATTSELIESAKESSSKQTQQKENNPLDGVSDPVSVEDLHATILHAFGVDPSAESITPIGRPMAWSKGKIIETLFA